MHKKREMETSVTIGSMSQKKSRTLQSVSDMVLSLIVTGLLVGSLATFVWFTRQDSEVVLRPIDWQGVALGAKERTDLPTYGPIGLGKDWNATSARLETVGDSQVWRVGVVTPSQEFISVIVSKTELKRLINTYTTLELENEQTKRINDKTYTVLENEKDKLLFISENNVNILIYTTTNWDEINTFISKLGIPS